MTPFLRPARAVLAVVACLTLALGCSGGKKATLAPVTGTVTVGGQPLTSGQVSFVPTTKDVQAAGLSAGTIDSSGKYTIYTDGKAGAPLGTYKITVTPSMMPTADGKPPTMPFNNKYRDIATTSLTKEVIASPEAGRYDLSLEK
jgi:hypothetical protein